MSTIKIASFNINSLRVRQHDLLAWLQRDEIDIIALQETKVQNKDFPVEFFHEAGYHAYFLGEKGKNGIAVLSRPEAISLADKNPIGIDGEARFQALRFDRFTLVNTYVPQGREVGTDYFAYKLNWLLAMKDYFARHHSPSDNLLWVGDFNVAPTPLDIYAPDKLRGSVGFHPDEQAALEVVRAWGFEDIFRRHVPDGNQYTFFDYRIPNAVKRGMGWRIDHIWGTKSTAASSTGSYIALDQRLLDRPSDHAPIVASFTRT